MRKRFTPEEDEYLRLMHDIGFPTKQMARKLNRTFDSVSRRLYRLNRVRPRQPAGKLTITYVSWRPEVLAALREAANGPISWIVNIAVATYLEEHMGDCDFQTTISSDEDSGGHADIHMLPCENRGSSANSAENPYLHWSHYD